MLPNHFKSKFGGNDADGQAKRRAQSDAVAAIYQRLRTAGEEFIAVLGDFNDTPDNLPLHSLLSSELKDASEHPTFPDFEFLANNGNLGTGTFGWGNDANKIDYLLLSPALFDKITNGGIFRKRGVARQPPQTLGSLSRTHPETPRCV